MVWYHSPLINLVYEALRKLSRGEKPVLDEDLKNYIEMNHNIRLSRRELVEIIVKMEILGMISVSSSGKENLLIKLVRTSPDKNKISNR